MAFSFRRMNAVFWKDSRDLLKNKGLVASMLVLPLVLIIVPTGVVWAYTNLLSIVMWMLSYEF